MAEQRWFFGDYKTGDVLGELPVTSDSTWSNEIGQTTVTARVPWSVASSGLYAGIQPWSTYIAVAYGKDVVAGGPLLSDGYSDGVWTLNAKGSEAYFARRFMIPAAVKDNGYVMFNSTARPPAPYAYAAMQLGYANGTRSWREIVRFFFRQLLDAWPNTPTIYNQLVSEPGPFKERIEGIDFMLASDWVSNLRQQDTGVEVEFWPEWEDYTDPTSIFWRVEVGDPLLTPGRMGTWSADLVSDLTVDRDGSRLTTHQHVSGGRDADRPLSVTEVQDGPVMLEDLDTLQSVGDVAKLRARAKDLLAVKKRPILSVSFSVDAATSEIWRPGGWGLLAGVDAPHITSETRLRILGRSGSAGSDRMTVTCEPIQGGDTNAWLSASNVA